MPILKGVSDFELLEFHRQAPQEFLVLVLVISQVDSNGNRGSGLLSWIIKPKTEF